MNEWKTYKLGEIARFQTGKLNSNAAIEGGKYPFFTCSPTTLHIDNYAFDQEAILLAGNNAEGNFSIKYYNGKFNAYQRTYIIEAITEYCETRYLFYSLKLYLQHFKYISQGTSTKFLTASILRNIPISLPPLETQKLIADILSAIDDKIELNHRINANLEQQAQALYKSWFVDFEPFGGKMPEDWRVGTLGEIITITSGKHPKNRVSIKTKDVNIPIVGAADIIGYTNEMLYSIPILIIGRVGTHGIVQRFSTKCWPSDNTLVIQTKYYEMCYQLLKQIDYKKLNRGSTQPLITQTDIKGVEVIIPPIEILEEYEKRVSILFHSINNYDIENSSLSALRDTLLPKLMSGEITV